MTRASCLLFLLCFSHLNFSQINQPKHEFRGVWIASVANIDWPSKPDLNSEVQKEEFLKILHLHKSNGMNAVVVQIRPAADAFYPSIYEPWSKWLTGKLGKAPQPYYDPLKFMIEASHKLGLELHAWFNPYRGMVNVDTANVDSASVAFQHPEWFVKYNKNLYFNPGLPEARQHVVNVVMDVVNRYDIDAIHFDDYFYPYKVAGINFPDSSTFAKSGANFQSIDDWRRNNVDLLIEKISDSLRQVKPYVKFGISPFGVWRNQDKDPKGSATQAGQTCYDDLYADVIKWLQNDWIDYITPQIYWTIGFDRAPYEVIAKWWNQNNFGKPVYIGHGAYRIDSNADARWKEPNQIPKQIRLNRSLENIKGSTYFSSKSFIPNPLGINDSLQQKLYKYPAIIPTSKQKDNAQQYKLTFTGGKQGIFIQWTESAQLSALSSHSRYVIYRFGEKEEIDLAKVGKILAIVPDTNPHASTTQRYHDDTAKKGKKYVYVVTSLNRYQNESKPSHAFAVKNRKNYWRVYEPISL